MPHSTLKLIPGVDQNRTLALNESAISTTNLVRFVPDKQNIGLVQKLGGWTKFYTSNIGSPIRALWAWEDTNGNQYLGVGNETIYLPTTATSGTGSTSTITFSGTHDFSANDPIVVTGVDPTSYNGFYTVTSSTTNTVSYSSSSIGAQVLAGYVLPADNLSVISNGVQTVITPRSDSQNIAVSANTVTGSSIVQINAVGSNINNFDTVDIVTQISVGGVILFGNYVATYAGADAFLITATDSLGNPVQASSSVTAGGATPRYYTVSGQSYVDIVLYNHEIGRAHV